MLKKTICTLPLISVLALAPLSVFASDDVSPAQSSLLSNIDVSGVVQTDYSRVSGKRSDFDFNDIEVRRGRMGASGVIAQEVKFKFVVDFDSPSNVHLMDAYIAFKPGFAPVEIKLGQFKTANSFDEQTSSSFSSTLERAAFTDVFELSRGVGASVAHKGARHTLTLGFFGGDITDNVFSRYAVAGRATYVPVLVDDLTVHTGVSFRYRNLDTDQPMYDYSQGVIAAPTGNIVSTGRLAHSDLFLGEEVVALKGRYWAAHEIGATIVNCMACANDPVLVGGYVEVGAFFNGRRTYSGGRFGRPEIYRSIRNGGLGGFSLVARFDVLDLNNGSVNGGSYQSITLGADWWPTPNTRVGLNLFKVDTDFGDIVPELAPAFATAIAGGLTREDAHGLTVRFQILI